MFDRTVIHAPQAGPKYVTVNEHRAPTDESIRLYKDMREKIEAEYVKTILGQMEPNRLTHAKIERSVNFMECKSTYHIAFRLNGTDHVVRVDSFEDSQERVCREIVGELMKKLGAPLYKEIRNLPREDTCQR